MHKRNLTTTKQISKETHDKNQQKNHRAFCGFFIKYKKRWDLVLM